MPNDFSLPDDMQNRGDKRSTRDRRKKATGRGFDDDADGSRRNAQQRDRRQNKNFRDLLYGEDDDE